MIFLIDCGRFSQSVNLQYKEETGPKKTRNVAMGVTFFRSRDNFTFLGRNQSLSRNMKLKDIIFYVILDHCVKFQSDITQRFEVMAL